MKLELEFNKLKEVVKAVGKAAKKNPIDGNIALVKIEAKENKLSLSVNNPSSIGVTVSVPADVSEEGEFVTSFYSLNMLSLMNCKNTAVVKSEGESLTIKYGKKAFTKLTAVNKVFSDVAVPEDDMPHVALPVSVFKQMFAETSFAVDDLVNSDTYAEKIDIADDVDGIIKFTLTACDRKRIAIRNAYTVKTGDFTGSVLVAPEQLKTAFAVINKNDGDLNIFIDDKKLYLTDGDTNICMPTLNKRFPSLDGILSNNKCSFSVDVPKEELLKALSCAQYLQNESKTNGITSSTIVRFSEGKLTVEYDENTNYSEDIEAKTTGDMPGTVLFDAELLKGVVEKYPAERLVIGGTSPKAPFWLCYGENEEYIYCVLPRVS